MVATAAASVAVGGTGTAAAGAGLVRERIFLLSNHSSRLLLFLSLLFAFAGRFFPAYEKVLLLGDSCRRRKFSHCWSPTQFWPSCCAPNTPGRSRGGGQLLSLVLQLMTAMYCCCCAYCSSQCTRTAASGHTVATVQCSHSPLRGMATRRWMLLRPMYTAH